MKSLRLYKARDIRYEEAPMPEIIKDDDVIIKVMVAGICGG